MTWPTREHRRAIAAGPREVTARVAQAARLWGADWQVDADAAGGRLALPVVAGLRRGVLRTRLAWQRPAGGASTEVVLAVDTAELALHAQAVVILLIAVVGGISTMLWPFWPRLLPLVPLGAILALGAWFLVVSKLRSSGPDDFLELVGKLAEGDIEADDEDDEPGDAA